MSDGVIIIGAGLAGLCCGLALHKEGVPFTILEASDAVGGRVRTDKHQGFLLDRGFQIFLSAYPEAQKVLDYGALNLKPFFSGAVVRTGGKFHSLADPLREPFRAIETLCAPIGTFADKLRVADMRHSLLSEGHHESPESVTTLEALKARGFSESIIKKFFRPFLGGIFLDQSLETSAKMFEFVFEMLARKDNTLPEGGMKAIPEQLASYLPADSIRFNAPVESIDGNKVILQNGQQLRGFAIVIATEEPQCKKLLHRPSTARFNSQTCLYFSAEKAPFDEPVLVLNGEEKGEVINLTVPSNVSRSYAPEGMSLISAVAANADTMSDATLEEAVRKQMSNWYGKQVQKWKHIRTYRIRYALPDQSPKAIAETDRRYKEGSSMYFCGDYKETGSINGAMLSGRKAAENVLRDLKIGAR